MRLWHKLLISYVVIIAAMLLVGHTGLRSAAQVGAGFHHVNKQLVPLLSHLEDLRFAGLRIVSSVSEYGLIKDHNAPSTQNQEQEDQAQQEEQELISSGQTVLQSALSACRSLLRNSPQERALMANIEVASFRLQSAGNEMIRLIDSGDRSKSFWRAREDFEKAELAFLDQVGAAHKFKMSQLDVQEKGAFGHISEATSMITLYLFIAILICILLGTISIVSTSGQLANLERAARKIASGYLDLKLPAFGNDEIGSLSASFVKMIESLKKSRSELLATNSYLDSIISSMIDALIVVGADGRVQDVNPAACRMLKHTRLELVGRPIGDLFKDPLQARSVIDVLLGKEGHDVSECTFVCGDGSEVIVSLSASIMLGGKEEGRLVCICQDVTLRKQAEEEIRYLAFYDHLTGLPNRTLFMDRCQQALAHARRYDTQVALLFFDLDRFKDVNDTLGHLAGDYLLKQVTQRLKGVVRQTDTVARLGGDEFVLLCSSIRDPDDAAAVARTLISLFKAPFEVDGTEVFTSASIGIVTFPTDGDDVFTLMKNADLAMYAAKEGGRKSYRYFSHQLNDLANERSVIEAGLRQALSNDELSIHYQPQFDLKTGGVVGVEALCRWTHPEMGAIPPDKFIPVAEQTGLIHALGEWVLERACSQAKAWQEMGFPISVAVNVSVCQLMMTEFPEKVRHILARTGVEPRFMELELTESMLMDKAIEAGSMLKRLKELGVMLAIDDFGTGYSSLSYLKDFCVDRLKIDKSFVHDLGTRSDVIAIVKAMIAIGHSLGFKVVAEGIETEEERQALTLFACDEGQGFHYARPMPSADLTAYLVHTAKKPPAVARFAPLPLAAVPTRTIPVPAIDAPRAVAIASFRSTGYN